VETEKRAAIINDFLASMSIFSSATNELMAEQLDSELGGQLTISQLRLLKLIARTDIRSISDVATFLGVSNAAASKAVDRLVRRNLVTRIESPDDRRATRLKLTRKGHELLERYQDVQNRVLEGLFRQFMPEDFIQMAGLLDQLSCDIVEHEAGPREVCFRCGIYFRDKCVLRGIIKSGCLCCKTREIKNNDDNDTHEHDLQGGK
jgi:DNA-binding MarR family transcriptional regulator